MGEAQVSSTTNVFNNTKEKYSKPIIHPHPPTLRARDTNTHHNKHTHDKTTEYQVTDDDNFYNNNNKHAQPRYNTTEDFMKARMAVVTPSTPESSVICDDKYVLSQDAPVPTIFPSSISTTMDTGATATVTTPGTVAKFAKAVCVSQQTFLDFAGRSIAGGNTGQITFMIENTEGEFGLITLRCNSMADAKESDPTYISANELLQAHVDRTIVLTKDKKYMVEAGFGTIPLENFTLVLTPIRCEDPPDLGAPLRKVSRSSFCTKNELKETAQPLEQAETLNQVAANSPPPPKPRWQSAGKVQ